VISLIGFLVVFCFMFGIYLQLRNMEMDNKFKQEMDNITKSQIVIQTKKQDRTEQSKKLDPIFKEAKTMLVNMGYSATEAKDLLAGTSGSVQERIEQAMQKVKIGS